MGQGLKSFKDNKKNIIGILGHQRGQKAPKIIEGHLSDVLCRDEETLRTHTGLFGQKYEPSFITSETHLHHTIFTKIKENSFLYIHSVFTFW